MKTLHEFPNQKRAIFRKVKEIKGLRGDVQIVRRTRNPADRQRDCGKGPFLIGTLLVPWAIIDGRRNLTHKAMLPETAECKRFQEVGALARGDPLGQVPSRDGP